ncbi:MAG: serine/threonine protein kinase [Planctomycetota bacterium]|nr:MAG: serine/threonine protein kinase [Planctomycetota bacterium]
MAADLEYLGPYRIDSILGRGGMGTVYKAFHSRSGEVVAVKVIAPAIADQVRFRRRFAAEVEVLKRLRHPNIVSLLGYGEERGLLFYSMEYVEGNSLQQHMHQVGRIPWEDVVEVGIQTTAALKHAHDMGIIHRDLKPANLLVGTGGIIKLTDFGIAKLFGATDMTAAGAVIGTADYMPPEQAEGKPVTVRSDLYGVGCVLYALLAGRPPFSGKSVPEVLYAVRYNAVPNLSDVVPEAPPELCLLIHELLEKDPSKRPPTALVVRNRLLALQHATGGRTTSSTPRAATSDVQEPPLGTELTSLDLSDVDDDDLRPTYPGGDTQAAPAPGPASSVDAETALLDDQHVAAAERGGADRLATGADDTAHREASSEQVEDFTQSPSVEMSGGQDSIGPLSSGGPSRYTPIEEDSSTSEFLWARGPDEAESGRDWVQILSMAGIVLLLVGSIAGVVWMIQPDSADDIYRRVMLAVESGDDSRLVAVQDDIEEFLARFPEDARAEELRTIADDLELSRWTRILQRRASRSGGVAALSAIEQAFLDCMTARSRDPQEAQEKLAAFLDVFGQIENLPRNQQRLVDLARHAQENGVWAKVEAPPAVEQLATLIQSAEKSLSGRALQAFYRDIITLYGDKAWAQPQVQRIRKILQPES